MKPLIAVFVVFIVQLYNCGLVFSKSINNTRIPELQLAEITVPIVNTTTDSTFTPIKHPKRTAAILALTLGMLGAHRLFLGCKPWVPVFYVLTVGGVFFILPLLDFLAIINTSDVSKFYNNSNIIMWLEK